MTLSPQQQRLYNFMLATGVDVDVAIAALHIELDVQSKLPTYRIAARQMQQMVGSAASRTNRKIKEFGHVIVPGDLKHTYRLTAIKP